MELPKMQCLQASLWKMPLKWEPISSYCSVLPLSFKRYFYSSNTNSSSSRSNTSDGKKKVPPSKKYQHTVFLPSSKFPSFVKNIKEHELQIKKEFEWDKQYDKHRSQEDRKEEFVLHDGPPYANGSPHIGHALNKILKDITVRQKMLEGFKVHYKPGWDCHGLPIELQATKLVQATGANTASSEVKTLAPLELRRVAREFAESWVEKQRQSFVQWGVLGDWSNAYLTAKPHYVARQLRLFDRLRKRGLIFQAHMPVYYSPSSRTTLAEAELEYRNHVSRSLTFALRVADMSPELQKKISSAGVDGLYLASFTTTPWSLPFNRAVAYNPSLEYCLVRLERDGRSLAVVWAKEALRNIDAIKWQWQHIADLSADELSSVRYNHPMYEEELCPVVPAQHATADLGSGLVHIAPAHGNEDYLVGRDHGLLLTTAIDDDGRYESSVGPALAGLRVLDEGTRAVLDVFKRRAGAGERTVPVVLRDSDVHHSYPHDWRTNQPVMIRATRQWFVDTHALRDLALRCVNGVRIFPHDEQGKKNLKQQLERPHWCISRQRVWGAPLPVFYDAASGELVQHDDIVEHVAGIIEREGSDAWWERSERDLLPPALVRDYDQRGQPLPTKGRDILDIWMDSGVTWQELDGRAADLVIEGQDQYRGWFQSTLLTAVADRGAAPYKGILVHGFTVDKHGLKMSKSAGNVISPDTITEGSEGRPGYGTDLLRWWVCRTGTLHEQPTCSDEILVSYANEVKRLRALIRLMLGCISDYDPSSHAPAYDELHLLDRYILHQLFLYDQTVWLHYDKLQYHVVARETINFIATQLSQLYVPAIKYRLYCGKADSTERRCVQYTLHAVLQCLQTTLTPVLPFLTHDVARYLLPRESPQLKIRCPLPLELYNPSVAELVQPGLRVRELLGTQLPNSVLASLPPSRLDVAVAAQPSVLDQLMKLQPEPHSTSSVLCDLLQTASVALTHPTIETPLGDDCAVALTLSESPMQACLRCRRYCAPPQAELCGECEQFVQRWSGDNSTAGGSGGIKDVLHAHPSQVGQ